MSTPLHYKLTLRFETLSALHPGSGENRGQTDSEITRDGFGRPILRATSIIGSIRHELSRPGLFSESELRLAFGWADLTGHASNDDSPSLVSVSDALIERCILETREGVGIDRVTGSARDGIKYNLTVVARGAQFSIVMRADCSVRDAALVESILATANVRCKAGMVRFGGRTTRGFGSLKLLESTYAKVDDRADFVASTMALARDQWISKDLPATARVSTAPVIRFTIGFRMVSALFSKAAIASNMALPQTGVTARVGGAANDGTPSTLERSIGLLLSGSSAKGVLRSAAEYQVRTVLGIDPTDQSGFDGQLDVLGVTGLFGWSSDADDDGHVAALQVDDCYGQRSIAQKLWRDITRAATEAKEGDWSQIRSLLDTAGLNSWRTMVHNTINEFTGGVADKRLFSTLVPLGESFEPLVLTIDFHKLQAHSVTEQQALLALLLSVLRDVKRGATPFGWGTSKGFGHLDRGSEITMQILVGASPAGTDDQTQQHHLVFTGMGDMDLPEAAGSQLWDPFCQELAPWRTVLGQALSDWYDQGSIPSNTTTNTEVAA